MQRKLGAYLKEEAKRQQHRARNRRGDGRRKEDKGPSVIPQIEIVERGPGQGRGIGI